MNGFFDKIGYEQRQKPVLANNLIVDLQNFKGFDFDLR